MQQHREAQDEADLLESECWPEQPGRHELRHLVKRSRVVETAGQPQERNVGEYEEEPGGTLRRPA